MDNKSHNEIKNFVQGRYVAASEAAWRILKFPIQHHSPNVYRLAIHLPQQHSITYNPDKLNEMEISKLDETLETSFDLINQIHNNSTQSVDIQPPIDLSEEQKKIAKILEKNSQTTLLAWFKLNQTDPDAHHHLYRDIAKHYVFEKDKRVWKKRKTPNFKTVGRIYSVHTKDMERFSLRLLLNHVRGAASYDQLKFYEGVQHTTFQSAATARGLLEDANQAIDCIEEAYNILCDPHQFRSFFCQFIINCSPDVGTLWTHFKDKLSHDILYNQRNIQNNPNLQMTEDFHNLALIKIKQILEIEGSNIAYFVDLPQLTINQIDLLNRRYNNDAIIFNSSILQNALETYNKNYPTLNHEQKECFDSIITESNLIGRIFIFEKY
jgi:hypothetical protein